MDAQAVAIAIEIDWLAFDVLHDDVRRAIGRHSTVQQLGDVRMIERGKDLTFDFETPSHMLRCEPSLDQLDRDQLLELMVGALCQDHFAHASRAQRLDDAIGTQHLSNVVASLCFGRSEGCIDFEVPPVRRARAQTIHRALEETFVGAADIPEKSEPVARCEGLRLTHDLLERDRIGRTHDPALHIDR